MNTAKPWLLILLRSRALWEVAGRADRPALLPPSATGLGCCGLDPIYAYFERDQQVSAAR
jgi:hypothetical protein